MVEAGRDIFKKIARAGVMGSLSLSVLTLSPGLALAGNLNSETEYYQQNTQDQFLRIVSRSLSEINRVLNFPAQVPFKPNPQRELLRYDRQNLSWLLERKLPISVADEIADDIEEYFPTQTVIKFARVFKEVDKNIGLDWLDSLTFDPNHSSTYHHPPHRISLGLTTINSQRIYYAANLAHELAHGIYHLGNNRDRFLEIRGFEWQAPDTDLSFVRPYARTNASEDFSTTFAHVLVKPSVILAKIDEVTFIDPRAGEKLLKKYLFMVDILGGQKYQDDAIPLKNTL